MKRIRKNITILLLFAMIVQVVVPIASNFAFGEGSEDFRLTEIKIDGDKATVDWQYDFDSSRVDTEFELELELEEEGKAYELDFGEEEKLEGQLVDNKSKIKIADYTISEDGKMEVSIYDLEEEVRELLESELDQGESIIQSEDTDQSVSEHVYDEIGRAHV